MRIYDLTFWILAVRGTLTHATAVYRVTSFKRYRKDEKALHVGEMGSCC